MNDNVFALLLVGLTLLLEAIEGLNPVITFLIALATFIYIVAKAVLTIIEIRNKLKDKE